MTLKKLNVGCGRNILAGWENLDSYPLPGVNIVADLDACGQTPLPLADARSTSFCCRTSWSTSATCCR